MAEIANPQVAGSGTWFVPIWITLVRDDDGYSHMNPLFAPKQIIEEVNGYFNSSIRFYVCGITYLNSDQYYNLRRVTNVNGPSEVPALLAELHGNNPTEYQKGYIDVIFVGSIDGGSPSLSGNYAYPPSGSFRGAVLMKDFDSNILSHEFGHYFGLLHTFHGGFVPDPIHPEWAQYVHDPVDPIGHPVVLSTGTFTCEETGDHICDTPAEPSPWGCFGSPANCTSSCSPAFDPLGLPYNPSPYNLMSYAAPCKNQFTAGQMDVMTELLTGHPDWEFLIDLEEPECQDLPFDRGMLVRNCEGIFRSNGIPPDPAPAFTPMEEVEVAFENVSGYNCDALTNNGGVYKNFPCLSNPVYNSPDLLSLLPELNYAGGTGSDAISGYDLTLISRHILGLELFENPFQIIAADANKSGSVTTFDILELRKLILGIYQNLPNNTRWRYVPDYCFEDHDFTDQFYDGNPFNATWNNPDEPTPIPPANNNRSYNGGSIPNANSWMDHVTISPFSPIARNTRVPWSFTGVMVGDVNCDAELPFTTEEPEKEFSVTPHTLINTNQMFTLEVKSLSNINVATWQLGIDFSEDTLQLIQIQPGNTGEPFSIDNFGLTGQESGLIRALNFSEDGSTLNFGNKTMFKIVFRALKPISNIGQVVRLKKSVLPVKIFDGNGVEFQNVNLNLTVASGASTFSKPNVGGYNGSSSNDEGNQPMVSTYPTPFYNEVVFKLDLPYASSVSLSIFDNVGKLMTERDFVGYKGSNSFEVGDMANYTAGFYWYTIRTENGLATGKLIKK
jgi:hypothetical protein